MKRFLPLVVVLLLGGLLVPAGATALIQIDRGIGGVRLDNTKAQVRAALGAPDSARNGTNDFGRFTRYVYRPERMTVVFQGGRKVTSVTTTGLGDRTTRGIGVGSKEATVDKRVPGVKCETIAGFRTCHTNDFTAGKRVTDFVIRKGRVSRVSIGIVID